MNKQSPAIYAHQLDDKDLDDATLWAAIDSAAASLSTTTTTPISHKLHHHHKSLPPSPNIPYPSPLLNLPNSPKPNPKSRPRHLMADVGEVLNHGHHYRPNKIVARPCVSELSESSPPATLAVVKHVQQRTPTTPSYSSPRFSEGSPFSCGMSEESTMTHSLAGRFPTVSLFKEYQNAAMAILEKSDYTMISGNPFIKKSGWRKISFYFNLSYEIKDKTIEFDDNRNVQRAEFVVRAYMQGGRFSDGWGSCERREKRFLKPNHDIPSTAETRAKNKACQDLLGIGEYRPGVHAQR